MYEFNHSQRRQNWLVLDSAAVSYGKATSYLPVLELLRRYFKIDARDDVRAIREKVTGKVLTLARTLEPTLPALLALLDVPVDEPTWSALDPVERRRLTLDAVKTLWFEEARERPLLLIVEDLHWVDGETQALLDDLVDGLGSTTRLLLLGLITGTPGIARVIMRRSVLIRWSARMSTSFSKLFLARILRWTSSNGC